MNLPLPTYRNDRDLPFCPGCGHTIVLDQLDKALVDLQLDARQVVIVSDIGCVGLGDQYFATNAFHGLHGRSVAYASGIKLANPDLQVVVLIGDGGCGIGGTHLVSAARRNVGITVLVFNNFNFGMTGGQHSVMTPLGARTPTTLAGNLEQPLDICATVAANGAGYVWRGTSFEKDLAARIAEAVSHDGFALLDIWELCTAYFVPNNDFSKKLLDATLADSGMAAGLIAGQADRPEYAAALRAGRASTRSHLTARPLPVRYDASLDREYRIVVAGSAGGKVRSSARMLGQAALLSGLWATQRDDYPVTIMSGHSVSEVILSPQEIRYSGVERPDCLLVLSEEGLGKVRHYLSRMTAADRLVVTPEFVDLQSPARKTVLDFAALGFRPRRKALAVAGIAALVHLLDLFPAAAFAEAVRLSGHPEAVDSGLQALEGMAGLVSER